jgi:hypothetical protein
MFIELGPIDERAVWLDDSQNVTGKAQEFARGLNGCIA